MNDFNYPDPDYFRDVIDELKAISCCWRYKDPAAGCVVCPFKKDKPVECECNPYGRLVDTIKEIMLQLKGDKAEHFLSVINACSLCEHYCCDCQYVNESIEIHAAVLLKHVYEFLTEEGLYDEDGSVSEKGEGLRVSDTLALLKTTGLTKESWPKNRGGLLF